MKIKEILDRNFGFVNQNSKTAAKREILEWINETINESKIKQKTGLVMSEETYNKFLEDLKEKFNAHL